LNLLIAPVNGNPDRTSDRIEAATLNLSNR